MRRSAAPSARASKKMKFVTPFLAGNNLNKDENSKNSLAGLHATSCQVRRAEGSCIILMWVDSGDLLI